MPKMSDLAKFMKATAAPLGASGSKRVAKATEPAPATSVKSTLLSVPPVGTPFSQAADLSTGTDEERKTESPGKELLLQSMLAAVPTLIGAAFGDTGGALGGAAGSKAVTDYQTIKATQKDLERKEKTEQFDRGVKAQVLANQAEGLNIKREQVKATQDTAAAVRDVKKDNKRREELRRFQEDFNNDLVVKKSREARANLPSMKEYINRGTGQDFQAVKFKLATIFNGARPTDADVASFSGSQALWDKIEQYAQLKASDKISEPNKKELLLLVDTMEKEADRNMRQASEYRVGQAVGRKLGEKEELTEILSLPPMLQDDEDDASKEAELDRIFGGK